MASTSSAGSKTCLPLPLPLPLRCSDGPLNAFVLQPRPRPLAGPNEDLLRVALLFWKLYHLSH